ncbi:MAG TPA: hypothetical protein V6D05_02115 [Stenomitos sp.]
MFEATRRFLASVPVLSTLIEAAFKLSPVAGNNPEELRDHLSDIQKQVVGALKEAKNLYRVENLPNESFTCPACTFEARGAYWELSNPTTGRRGIFHSGLLHGFIQHGTVSLDEPIVNLSDIYVGDREIHLDLSALMRVLAGADLPADVIAECSAFAQNPDAFPGAKLAAR